MMGYLQTILHPVTSHQVDEYFVHRGSGRLEGNVFELEFIWVGNFTALKLIVFGMIALRFSKITNTADGTLRRMKLYQARSPLKGALLLANKLVLCVVKIPLAAVAAAGFWDVDRGLLGRWSQGVTLFLRGNPGMWKATGNRPGSFVMT